MVYVRESLIEKKVSKWAEKNSIRPLKFSPVSSGGWPDHCYLYQYPKMAFIEFKRPGGKPDERQVERIKELRSRGYPVEVHDDYESAIAFLAATLLST